MQSFLLLNISMWQAFRNTDVKETQGIVDLCFSILTLIYAVTATIFPFIFLRRNFEKLSDQKFKAKYDSLYQNMDHYKRQALKNTSYFAGRRLVFAFIIVFCDFSTVLQVFLSDICSTLLLCYYVSALPMDSKINNNVQIFNELMVLLCTWLAL